MSLSYEEFKERVESGNYETRVNAQRAIGVWTRHNKFSTAKDRKLAVALVDEYSFPKTDAPSAGGLTADDFKEKITRNKYKTAGRAKTAVGKSKLSEAEKKDVRQHIEAHFSGAKPSRSPKKKTRKRGSDGRVLNGAGDSRTVTLFKLSQYPDAFALVAHLIAKAVDEHIMLPELHEDVKSIASLL